jgi:lipopolysaccharide/colanic/teichoic acid biosynthesis glycosyltransferase
MLNILRFDYEYLQRGSLTFDLKISGMTFMKVLRSEGIQH